MTLSVSRASASLVQEASKRTGPRPDDEHGHRIRFEFHDWAFVCMGSTVTTLRPDFRALVARRVVGLRSQFRVEALVWPLSELRDPHQTLPSQASCLAYGARRSLREC